MTSEDFKEMKALSDKAADLRGRLFCMLGSLSDDNYSEWKGKGGDLVAELNRTEMELKRRVNGNESELVQLADVGKNAEYYKRKADKARTLAKTLARRKS